MSSPSTRIDSDESLLDLARRTLIKHEGRKLHVYQDSLGIRTIGTGFNLEAPGAREIATQVGADYDALLAGTQDLTLGQNDQILTLQIISAIEWLSKLFPAFSSYSLSRRVALIDMAFMGEGHFLGFHNLIRDVQAGDWPDAGKEELASKWAVQVGSRAHDDLLLLSAG